MLKVYFRYSCDLSIQVIKYLREHNKTVELLNISEISRRDIVHVLQYSKNGFKDFLKDREQITEELEVKFNLLEHLTFDEAVIDNFTLDNIQKSQID